MLDLRRLHYFLAIEKHGSISGAARALRVAQPALSYHVAAMEAELGQPLLVRQAHGVRLTAGGKVLSGHARIIATQVRRAEEELRRKETSSGRVIKLALIPSLAGTLAPAIVRAAAARLPDVTLRLREARTEDSRDMILDGRIDFAINIGSNFVCDGEPLLRESLFLAAVPEQGKPSVRKIDFSELSTLGLILPPRGNPLREIIDRVAREKGVSLSVKAEAEGQEVIKEMILAGLGSTITSWHGIRREVLEGSLAAAAIRNPALDRVIVIEQRPALDTGLARELKAALRSACNLRLENLGSFSML